MCGIGGIIGGAMRADERESAALRLQAALRHRGPDDHAHSISGPAVLVHNRLAILDPTEGGRQPMTRGPLTITFNGEIYSFRELREELIGAGESFTTGTDTEVVLALYAREGAACLPRLRGMFALAIWDEREKSCFLARDPFGIKPLYYAPVAGGGLAFASELRALLESNLIPRRIDAGGLNGFLANGSVPGPHTLVAKVKCLEAGGWLRWRDGAITTGRYFDLGQPEVASPEGTVSLRAALLDSVRHHLVSDVPVGLLLSGGVDSAALLALMRDCGASDIATFSLGVEDAALDELPAARETALHFGATHHRLLLTQELARHWIDDFIEALDQPTLDGFNTWCACKLAGDHGCKVVLSGIGADELFGGYPSFEHVPRLAAAGRWLTPMGMPLAAGPAARWLRPPARLGRTLEFFAGPPDLSRAYDAFRGVFTCAEAAQIRAAVPGFEGLETHPETERLPSFDGDEAISQLELTRYLRNQLLRDADTMSMAHGVELRVPLLDVPLLAALRRIPAHERFGAHKSALREAVPGWTTFSQAQRKRGFDLPFAAWLRHEWADLADELPPFTDVSLKPWYRQWALIVLLRWLRRHRLLPA